MNREVILPGTNPGLVRDLLDLRGEIERIEAILRSGMGRQAQQSAALITAARAGRRLDRIHRAALSEIC